MKGKKGFTLIELLLVVMIVGFMLAVIVPRGLRATTDAKYSLVRQNCAELASFGNNWVEQQMLAQDSSSTATKGNYLASLVRPNAAGLTAAWIADSGGVSNWNSASGLYIRITGRNMTGAVPSFNAFPDNPVEEIIDPTKMLRNPFNGASVFSMANLPITVGPPGRPIPGAIACAYAADSSTGGTFDYFAFIFQGTDSTKSHIDPVNADFHGGMGDPGGAPFPLANLREGVFFAKVRQ